MFIARPYWYSLALDTWHNHVRRLATHDLADVRDALARTVAGRDADAEKLAAVERELVNRNRHAPR